MNPEPVQVDDEIEEENLDDTLKPEELSPETEPTSDANAVGEDKEEKIDTDEGTDGKATDEIEKKGDPDSSKREENKEKEYTWPIGLPWEPKESDKKEKQEKAKLEKVKVLYNERVFLFFYYFFSLSFTFFSFYLAIILLLRANH